MYYYFIYFVSFLISSTAQYGPSNLGIIGIHLTAICLKIYWRKKERRRLHLNNVTKIVNPCYT